jgi:hypothetical protein
MEFKCELARSDGKTLAQKYTILRVFESRTVLYSQQDFEPGPLGGRARRLPVFNYDYIISHAGILQQNTC